MDSDTLNTIKNNFANELQEAYSGKKTSLPFIVHQLPSSSLVKENQLFEVIVIGGSVFKKAILKKTANGIEILKKEREQRLSFRDENDFLMFINEQLDANIGTLALNFAYPIKPIFEKGRLDGILLKVTKEGSFQGLIGKKVGSEIEDYILKKRNKKIAVSLANDTVCLLLAGLTKHKWEELAGGVDGTGVNFAFFLDKNKLVNLESANFDKFPKSREGKIIDKESNIAGDWLFEKETAGAYLYKHFNLIIKEKKIDYPNISSTEELNDISLKNTPGGSRIALELLKRSAQLVSCQTGGIAEFKRRNMVFNMEGSLFWKANNYKETVEKTVKQLVPEYKVKFVEIKDSGILGAAKLVSL